MRVPPPNGLRVNVALPSPGIAAPVHDGRDGHEVWLENIEHGVRETADQRAPRHAANDGVTLGGLLDLRQGVGHLSEELASQSWTVSLVPREGDVEVCLGLGQRRDAASAAPMFNLVQDVAPGAPAVGICEV